MSVTVPRFPPSVARALAEPAGAVTVHLTLPRRLRGRPPTVATPLMETVYDGRLLVALVLDPSGAVRFVRTGPAEGPRERELAVGDLLDATWWVVTLRWDADEMDVAVRRTG